MSPLVRRRRIFASDVEEIGRVCFGARRHGPCDGSPVFRVGYISRGGDLRFTSAPIQDEAYAAAAARVLSEFIQGEVKLVP